MHMHRAADLVTDEPIWLKKAPGYFSFVAAGHDQEAACGMLCRQKWISVPDFPASRQ